MAEIIRCPSCYQKLAPSDFQCPRCELLLENHLDDEPTGPNEVSVVRAMMERPQGTVSRVRPAPPERPSAKSEAPTAVYPVPILLDQVIPRVVAGLSLTSLSLTPFEAFVVCSMDGKTRADQLMVILQLQYIELQAVLNTLQSRGVVSLEAPPRPSTPARAKPPTLSNPAQVQSAPKASEPVRKGPVLPAPAAVAQGGERATDSRVKLGEGVAKNRKILDALKNVKKAGETAARPETSEKPKSADELAADGALQVAIRMEQDGRVDEAVRYLERAISRSPDAAPLLNRLAIVLVRDRRNFTEAERLLRQALKLAPEHAVYKKNLVMVLTRAARDNTGIHRRR
jgi:hypothetical protein